MTRPYKKVSMSNWNEISESLYVIPDTPQFFRGLFLDYLVCIWKSHYVLLCDCCCAVQLLYKIVKQNDLFF